MKGYQSSAYKIFNLKVYRYFYFEKDGLGEGG